MEINEAQYERIKDVMPVQWSSVSLTSFKLLNALLYMLEHRAK